MIEILDCHPLNTVQDRGRFGARRFGVSTSGVMDPVALAVGNGLLGNDPDAAAIEVQSFPFRARFAAETAFALTGADCGARLDGRPLLPWSGHVAAAGAVLELGYPRSGARAYLTVAGGIDLAPVMGSRSTHLRAGFGGFDGRSLAPGDRLPVPAGAGLGLPPGGVAACPPDAVLASGEGADALAIRVLRAGEYERFTPESRDAFWSASWKVGHQSDRTGYRFAGPRLTLDAPIEMRSYGVVPGLIQVPPAGEPIVQMSDANTVGGYPKIAAVIEADFWRLGQARPGSLVAFRDVDHAEAVAAMAPLRRYLEAVRAGASLVRS